MKAIVHPDDSFRYVYDLTMDCREQKELFLGRFDSPEEAWKFVHKYFKETAESSFCVVEYRRIFTLN